MRKYGLKTKALAGLLALASGCGALKPDELGISANWTVPRLSQEHKIMSKVQRVMGRANTFRDAAEDGRMVIPQIKAKYQAERFSDSPFLENTNFYGSVSYTKGSIATGYAIGELDNTKQFFRAGVGVEHFFFPRESKINLGVEASVDYYYGHWGARFNSPLVRVNYHGLDRGPGCYAGLVVEGEIPKEVKSLFPIFEDARWTITGGWNQANVGSYGDYRGPVMGVGITINLTNK